MIELIVFIKIILYIYIYIFLRFSLNIDTSHLDWFFLNYLGY